MTILFRLYIGQIYSSFFPIKVKYISNRQAFNPWTNSNLRKFISYKSQLFRLGILTKDENKIYRNKLQSIIRKCKINYYNALFFKLKGNLSKTWRTIKSLMGNNLNSGMIKK